MKNAFAGQVGVTLEADALTLELDTETVGEDELDAEDEVETVDEAAELDPEETDEAAEPETAVPKQAIPPSLYVFAVVPRGQELKQVFP